MLKKIDWKRWGIAFRYFALKRYTRDSWMRSAIWGFTVIALILCFVIYGFLSDWLDVTMLGKEDIQFGGGIAMFVSSLIALFFYRVVIHFFHWLIYRKQTECLPLRPPCKFVRVYIALFLGSALIEAINMLPIKNPSYNLPIMILKLLAIGVAVCFYKLLTMAFESKKMIFFYKKNLKMCER